MPKSYKINSNLVALMGQDSLSVFAFEELSQKIKKATNFNLISANDFYLIETSCPWEKINEKKRDQVYKLLQTVDQNSDLSIEKYLYVSPRQGVQSPWSSKAKNIFESCNLNEITKLEKLISFNIDTENKDLDRLKNFLFDPLTEDIFQGTNQFKEAFNIPNKKNTTFISLHNDTKSLNELNNSMGLALNDYEKEYLINGYKELSKETSDVELMMFSQINSEHCRHKIFNSTWLENGEEKKNSLFGFIKNTYKNYSDGVLSAYSDNAAVISGLGRLRFYPDPLSREYSFKNEDNNLCIKVETHNHPTAIAPLPGAATGSGGEIRDEGATGRGAKPKAGLCGFSVSHLRFPDNRETWEEDEDKPKRIASPLQIMMEAPIGAASFNNEFGRPNILGYFRSFEYRDINTNEHYGFHKPIMLAGGLGNIRPTHTDKLKVSSSAKIIVLGGPGYLIGLGGGSASSVESGKSKEGLDFASVQRSNPEMERRCQEVIDQCWQLGDSNPIAFIHDVGAGGLSNALPELAKDCSLGAIIDLSKIPIEDESMSSLEIWCNESQERYVIAIEESELNLFEKICLREKCPYAVVGEFTEKNKFILLDKESKQNPIDLDMGFIFGAKEQLKRNLVKPIKKIFTESIIDFNLKKIFLDVLRHPTVACKNFLITIGDRNVGGLTYRDQLIGPLQIPVADNGITLSCYKSVEGEAMSIGERSPVAIYDAPASGRLAISESLTNILSSGIEDISKVKLSANWMASPNTDSNNFDLYETVRTISEDLCAAWNITIPVGKDSLSMETTWDNKRTTSPLTLIISAFSQIRDVTKSVTPDFKNDSDLIVAKIDFGVNKNRLGGSILSEVLGKELGAVPDMDFIEEFPIVFNHIAKLINEEKVFAYHDISDGGLAACITEMMMAGDCGFSIDLNLKKDQLYKELFSEEIGMVIQISRETFESLKNYFKKIKCEEFLKEIGKTTKEDNLKINSIDIQETFTFEDLMKNWTSVSTQIKKLRDNPQSAKSEAVAFLDKQKNKLQQKINFKSSLINFSSRPKMGVIRDQGINGQVEMAAAFNEAGFNVLDIHMSDLKTDSINLDDFNGLAFPGGFSYGDVLGAGRGWSNSILMNTKLADIFEKFFNRSDTFSLGVCNGCQVLSEMQSIIPGTNNWPSLKKNISNQFEARLVQLKLNPSKSIFFQGMENSQLIVPVAHGEGRMVFKNDSDIDKLFKNNQIPLQYADNSGAPTEEYPSNPNGSNQGITSVCSDDGRVTILMPHPERAFLNTQLSWTDENESILSPWMEMFVNARRMIN
jgi:phosphoribosylformylglycinamidine synthase